MAQAPNILFILVDQVRACSLPTWGETQIETPHLQASGRRERAAGQHDRDRAGLHTLPRHVDYRPSPADDRPHHEFHQLRAMTRSASATSSRAAATARPGWASGICTAAPSRRSTAATTCPRAATGSVSSTGAATTSTPTTSAARSTPRTGTTSAGRATRPTRWRAIQSSSWRAFAADERFCLFVSPHQAHYTPYQLCAGEILRAPAGQTDAAGQRAAANGGALTGARCATIWP